MIDHDADVVKSFVSRIRRQLVQAKGQSIRMEVHSQSEAEAVLSVFSPREKTMIKLFWQGTGPPETREI